MVNSANLSEADLAEALAGKLIKGHFHVYFGSGMVSFFIKDDAELQSLIDTKHTINGHEVVFMKYVTTRLECNNLLMKITSLSTQSQPFAAEDLKVRTHSARDIHLPSIDQPSTYLFVAFSRLQERIQKEFGAINYFAPKDLKDDAVVLKITFENTAHAEKLYDSVNNSSHNILGCK